MSAGPAADSSRAKAITMKINIMSNRHGKCCSSNLGKRERIKCGIQILLSGAFKHIFAGSLAETWRKVSRRVTFTTDQACKCPAVLKEVEVVEELKQGEEVQ